MSFFHIKNSSRALVTLVNIITSFMRFSSQKVSNEKIIVINNTQDLSVSLTVFRWYAIMRSNLVN